MDIGDHSSGGGGPAGLDGSGGLSARARLDRVAVLAEQRDRIEADLAAAVAAADGVNAWAASGDLSGRQWISSYTATSGRHASVLLRLARFTNNFPTTGQALAAGTLSYGHALVLAKAVTAERAEFYADAEQTLLDLAARMPCVDDYACAVAHWVALCDQERDAGGGNRSRRQRLTVIRELDGWIELHGRLDPATAALFQAALEDCDTGPDPIGGPTPPRSTAERRADALGEMARRALRGPGEGPGNPEATFNIHADTDTITRARDPRRPDRLEEVVNRSVHGPLPVQDLDMYGCTSYLSLVVQNRGQVVALTSRQRLFTPAQNRALDARDGGCVFPGCDLPSGWCDAHHLQPNGPTNLDNAALLCRRHHRLVHHGWTLTRTPQGWTATDRRGRTWTGRPAPPPPTGPA